MTDESDKLSGKQSQGKKRRKKPQKKGPPQGKGRSHGHAATGGKRQAQTRGARSQKRQSQDITVREIASGQFELVYSPRLRQFREDIEEVYDIIAHEEWDLAVDELLWLLQECRELLEAHQLLGRIALHRGNLELARGHLGYAFELGLKALGKNFAGQLPFSRPNNRTFLQAGRDLVACLLRLGERALADSVAGQLLAWTPDDPLSIRQLLETGPACGATDQSKGKDPDTQATGCEDSARPTEL